MKQRQFGFLKFLTDHPHSINESYLRHAVFAFKKAIKLFWIGLNLFLHGILPNLRMNYARDEIINLADTLLSRNPKASDNIKTDITETIGKTPLIKLSQFSSPSVKLYAKCEMFNPSLSIKDRITLNMILDLKKANKLHPGGIIIEASSGNTGSSLAMLGACLGYNTIITVPHKTSQEKIKTMRAFGATVLVSSPGASKASPEHYVNKAKLIQQRTPNSVLLNQYENPINPDTHYQETAKEIYDALDRDIDYIVAGASSGGTISGIGKFIKAKQPACKMVMPDPVGSIYREYFLHKNPRASLSPYKVEGIGKDYICKTIDFALIDDVIPVTDTQAFSMAKKLATTTGILAGGSSGAALWVANELVKRHTVDGENINIVVILPDSGFKYLSTFYSDDDSSDDAGINTARVGEASAV